MNVPFMDLGVQYRSLKSEIDQAIEQTIRTNGFVGGPAVTEFEEAFAAFCEIENCAAVGNGTDAITLSLRALGIGPGDEVITVPNTFIATSEAIVLVGAKPVFIDVDPDTLLMDPKKLEIAINKRTKAIVPVHLFGQACDMDAILAIAQSYDLKVVEDTAQAHGARWKGRRVGTFGDLGCFSFYPGKNLGAFGDAGAVVGRDENLVGAIRRLANHGRDTKYEHDIIGTNSRMDGMQARILSAKLPRLDSWNAARRQVAKRYLENLIGVDDVLPTKINSKCDPVWHLFTCRLNRRDELREHLSLQGISTGIHYPLPLHLQPAHQDLGLGEGAFPVAENAARELISLPMFPEMPLEAVDFVCDKIREFAAS